MPVQIFPRVHPPPKKTTPVLVPLAWDYINGPFCIYQIGVENMDASLAPIWVSRDAENTKVLYHAYVGGQPLNWRPPMDFCTFIEPIHIITTDSVRVLVFGKFVDIQMESVVEFYGEARTYTGPKLPIVMHRI